MRLTEFSTLVVAEFGRIRGDAIVADHVLVTVGGLTPARAIEQGWDPREVWRALCEEFDVPENRRLGPDI